MSIFCFSQLLTLLILVFALLGMNLFGVLTKGIRVRARARARARVRARGALLGMIIFVRASTDP